MLRRVRAGLLTSELAAQFAAEVERLVALQAKEATSEADELAPALAAVERKIETLLDQLEENAGGSVAARLAKREADRDELKAKIAAQASRAAEPTIIVPPNLDEVYAAQVRRLDALLSGGER